MIYLLINHRCSKCSNPSFAILILTGTWYVNHLSIQFPTICFLGVPRSIPDSEMFHGKVQGLSGSGLRSTDMGRSVATCGQNGQGVMMEWPSSLNIADIMGDSCS